MAKAKKNLNVIPITQELFVIFDDCNDVIAVFKDYDELISKVNADHNDEYYHGLPIHIFKFEDIKKLVVRMPFLDEFNRNDS